MGCPTCDSDAPGWLWDSLMPCHDCDEGRGHQHEYDKRELKLVEARARKLRKRIKEYKEAP